MGIIVKTRFGISLIFLAAAYLAMCAPALGEDADKAGQSEKTHVYDPDLGWYKASEITRGSVTDAFRRARNLFEAGKYAEARDSFEKIHTTFKKNTLALKSFFYYAECLFHLKNYYAAHKAYRKILDMAPTFGRIKDVAEREYEIARILLDGVDPEFARDILADLLRGYPYESFSDDAYYWVAVSYHREGEYEDAVDTYNEILAKYPRSNWAEVAAFNIGRCCLARYKGMDYDPGPLIRAKNNLKRFIELFGSSGHVPEARKLIAKIDVELAGKELKTALFYLREDKPESARIYLDSILRNYPGTPAAKTAEQELKRINEKKDKDRNTPGKNNEGGEAQGEGE
jgi:outer membrane assembly lipoprotein YfiO